MTTDDTTAPTAERGHHLIVTKGEDWHPDEPHWRGEVVCLAPEKCNGWWECDEPHEVDGVSAADGPWEAPEDAPWAEEDVHEFHGVEHTWQGCGVGWTVPYEGGCVVQTVDTINDDAYEVGQAHGEGTYVVDDEWGDPGECQLIYVGPADTKEADRG